MPPRHRLALLGVSALGGCTSLLGIDELTVAGADGVAGTSTITWARPDGTTPQTGEDLTGYTIRAFVPDAAAPGGFIPIDGTGDATGHFTIPTAPAGDYLLELTRPGAPPALFAVDRLDLDAGYVTVGRPGATPATTTTPVTFTLDGLSPWRATDRLRATSYGAGTDLDPEPSAGRYRDLPGAGSTRVVMTSVDWLTGTVPDPGGAPARLVAAGDDLWIVHTRGEAITTDAAEAAQLVTPIDVYTTTDLAMTDGGAVTATGALAPILADHALQLRVDVGAWVASAIPGETQPTITCTGYSEPGAAYGVVHGFGLWTLIADPPMVDPTIAVSTLRYPHPTPASWPEMVRCDFSFSRQINLPDLGPMHVAARSSVDAPRTDRTRIAATLPPPRQVTVAGVDVQSGFADHLDVALDGGPVVIAWSASADASQYEVALRQLSLVNGAPVTARLATIATASTSVAVPASLFDADATYFLGVTAIRATGGLPAGQLRRTGAFAHRAANLSQAFTIRK